MGGSASKPARKLAKNIQNGEQLNNLRKNIGEDYLKNSTNRKNGPQIYTERPPKEAEQMEDQESGGKNTLFEKAVLKGVVNIRDTKANQNYNPNHESIQVLKNRSTIENQYKGLYVPKDADQPNIPERFLSNEEKKNMQDSELVKRKLQKTGINSWGLVEAKSLSDLIIEYRVFGDENFVKEAKKIDVNEENMGRLKALIDCGMLTLPSHKVTLQESIDPESRQTKQKLVTVKDNWVKTIREDFEKEKSNKLDLLTTSKKDKEIFEQFKMLENLVSKSQITTKPKEGPNEGTETVLKRPKKKLAKEVTKIL